MQIARLASLILTATLITSLLATATATAEPEFKPTGATVTGTGGTAVLEAVSGVDVVTCEKDTSTGTVTSATLLGGIVVHFLNCKATGEGGSNDTVHSVGASEGLIITATLHAVLGLFLPKTGTGVGLLLLPVSGTEFTTLSGNCAIETTKVTGNLAGEVQPIGKSSTSGTVKFGGAKGSESIKAFDLTTGGSLTAKLTAFSTGASENVTELLTFSSATEVT